jgi:hypothetical protein
VATQLELLHLHVYQVSAACAGLCGHMWAWSELSVRANRRCGFALQVNSHRLPLDSLLALTNLQQLEVSYSGGVSASQHPGHVTRSEKEPLHGACKRLRRD